MEFVYVVPRRELFPTAYPQGFLPFGEDLSEGEFRAAVARHGFYVEREVAERTPDWKQIIPYSVVVRRDEVLLLKRLGRGGEARLHDKLSIGVGGHINPEDVADEHNATVPERRDPIDAGSRRELREELTIDGDYTLERVGILNDDANAVGAVHLGLVQLVRTAGNVKIREEDVLEGRFVPRRELASRLAEGANFETWSARLVERLDDLLSSSRGALAHTAP